MSLSYRKIDGLSIFPPACRAFAEQQFFICIMQRCDPKSRVPQAPCSMHPESRIMKAGNGQHFEQAYNAQAAVDEQMLIVGERVSVAPNDKEELVPTVAAISPVVVEEVKAVLVDNGFYSEAAVTAVEQPPEGAPI